MKTPLLYGSVSALVGTILNFGFYFAGFHDSPEKLKTAQIVGGIVGLVVGIACMVLAMRERRREYPANQTWGYGSAYGTAFLTGLFGVLIASVLTYVYMKFVNPGFSEIVYQAEVAKMQAKGVSEAQIEAGSAMMRKFMTPGISSIFQIVFGSIIMALIALVVAIFVRKPLDTSARTEPTLV